jgi:2-amino-4-hydroxy-6-hydroxymethyldihydropteridine diphosphokinase
MTVPSRAVLSLGANLGDREQTLRDAVAALADHTVIVAASSIVQTPALKPHGVDHDAPAYLNAIVIVATELLPEQLLTLVNEIEHAHGRVREEHWGDRTLDIDIVAMDAVTLVTDRLVLPHPRAASRAFVLAPWAEIDPRAELPGAGAVADLLAELDETVTTYDARALV